MRFAMLVMLHGVYDYGRKRAKQMSACVSLPKLYGETIDPYVAVSCCSRRLRPLGQWLREWRSHSNASVRSRQDSRSLQTSEVPDDKRRMSTVRSRCSSLRERGGPFRCSLVSRLASGGSAGPGNVQGSLESKLKRSQTCSITASVVSSVTWSFVVRLANHNHHTCCRPVKLCTFIVAPFALLRHQQTLVYRYRSSCRPVDADPARSPSPTARFIYTTIEMSTLQLISPRGGIWAALTAGSASLRCPHTPSLHSPRPHDNPFC